MRKSKAQHRLLWTQLFTLLVVAALFTYTLLYFDALYQPYRSAYPRLSTLFSPLNMTVLTVLALINGIAIYHIKHAKEQLAIAAYMLINKLDVSAPLPHPVFINAFLQAAGLPKDYSLSLLKKMKMRHFMTHSRAINKAISEHKQAWQDLSVKP